MSDFVLFYFELWWVFFLFFEKKKQDFFLKEYVCQQKFTTCQIKKLKKEKTLHQIFFWFIFFHFAKVVKFC